MTLKTFILGLSASILFPAPLVIIKYAKNLIVNLHCYGKKGVTNACSKIHTEKLGENVKSLMQRAINL